jgi:hypothetical protein
MTAFEGRSVRTERPFLLLGVVCVLKDTKPRAIKVCLFSF